MELTMGDQHIQQGVESFEAKALVEFHSLYWLFFFVMYAYKHRVRYTIELWSIFAHSAVGFKNSCAVLHRLKDIQLLATKKNIL
jgi:hypothetical protein